MRRIIAFMLVCTLLTIGITSSQASETENDVRLQDELLIREESLLALGELMEVCRQVTAISIQVENRNGVNVTHTEIDPDDKNVLFRCVEYAIREATTAMASGGVDISPLLPAESTWKDNRTAIRSMMKEETYPEYLDEALSDPAAYAADEDLAPVFSRFDTMSLLSRIRYLESAESIFSDTMVLMVTFLKDFGPVTSLFWLFGINMGDLEKAASPDADSLLQETAVDPEGHDPELASFLSRLRYVSRRFKDMNEALRPFQNLINWF